jgi:hypothetical protein
MTQAFNLAQLANNLNTSGQLDGTDGLSGLIANANLASSGTASSGTYLRGDRTWAAVPAQKIIQVVQTRKTNTFSSNSTSYIDITGMSVAITPTSASSTILVSFVLNASANSAGWYGSQIKLLRNSTDIAVGDSSGGMSSCTLDFSNNVGNSTLITPMPMEWIDSPATTSAVTYKLQFRSIQNTTVWVNRSTYDNGTDVYDSLVVSSITAMEIGA